MKRLVIFLLPIIFMPLLILAQTQNEESQYIEWTGENETANFLVMQGITHLMNIEREKAYTFFEAAVEKDPTLFAPHVPLSWFSRGDKKAYHKVQAQKLVKGKNEVSRLYASLLDIPQGRAGASQWRTTWAKMHKIGFDGQYIHYQYALTLENINDQIAELEKLANINMKADRGYAHVHNILGYLYHREKNVNKAKMHFDKYLELYPEGYNSYDSMGEFYHEEGDLETALTYYKKAKEKYPAAVSATNSIKDIEAKLELKEKGNLVEVTAEHVAPHHVKDYLQWGEEYKAIADATNFKDFYVSMANGVYYYASIPGKSMTDLDKHNKDWKDWNQNNPDLVALYEKYKHTISKTEKSLWRHSPKYSYNPEGYKETENATYTRIYRGFVKFGHEKEVNQLLEEFKTIWKESDVSYPYAVYWNVYGEEGPSVSFLTRYTSAADWSAEEKEVIAKVGEEKLNDIMARWNEHILEWKSIERFPQPKLTHLNTDPIAAAND